MPKPLKWDPALPIHRIRIGATIFMVKGNFYFKWQFVGIISFDFHKFIRRKANPRGLERRDFTYCSY